MASRTQRVGEDKSLSYYYKEVENHPQLTAQEEKDLASRIEKGDPKAIEKLVTANLRFVIHVAKGFRNQGLSMADLINEGNLGLMTAARKFEPEKGFKFITYAVWWIRQNILKALEVQTRTIRIPANVLNDMNKLRKCEAGLSHSLERNPAPYEIASASDVPLKKINHTLESVYNSISLDSPVFDEGALTLQETLCDPVRPLQDEELIESDMAEDVTQALNTLPDRHRQILSLYFGMDGDDPATYQEIGIRLGVSRERVRQLKEDALKKLRHPMHRKRLGTYCS